MERSDFLIISQARMTSSRLPGKILKEVGGKSLLGYHIERLKKTGLRIVVATTVNHEDDAVVRFCEEEHIDCVRGSETDVLSRFAEVLKCHPAKYFIRVTSDCPLIDADLILQGVDEFIRADHGSLYLSNCFPRTYARGFDFEIASAEMLLNASDAATDSFDREHVTPYLWKNKQGSMALRNISQDVDHSNLRVCVDTIEDFRLIEILIVQYAAHHLSYTEIESILNNHPELVAINAMVEQKKS